MKNHLWLVRLLFVLGATLAPIPLLRADPPLKKVSVILDWYPEAENAGYFYALIHGYYKQAGLDVEISPVSSSASVEALVALDRFDFGLGSSDSVMIARSHGVPLLSIMGSLQHDPTGVMVHETSPVHTLSDLGGKTVAAQPGVAWLPYVISKYNLKDVRVIPLSTNYAPFLHDPNYIQQVFITSEPPIMEAKGIKVRTIWVKDSGCDAYLALETSDAFAAKNPEVVRAFVAATIKGWQGYATDPASTNAEILRRNPEMDPLQLKVSRDAMLQYHLIDGTDGVGQLNAPRLANQYKILRGLDIISADYDFTKAYSTQYLPPKSAGAPSKP